MAATSLLTHSTTAARTAGTAGALVERTVDTPIGPLHLVAGRRGLRAVLWPGEDGSRVTKSLSADRSEPAVPAAAAGAHAEVTLDRAAAQLAQYFAGTRLGFDVDIDPRGTTFQLRSWDYLRTIPFGTTSTYAHQAAALGDPAKARAVGAANGRNPLSIVVPCHRVLGSGGALTGFAGGLDSKMWLLEHERRVLADR